jgi:hypothetical protein
MPADFTMMALDEKREARAQESWKRPEPKFSACAKCSGTGWEIVYSLTTREGYGGSSFTKTEPITREVYDSFSGGKLDPKTQSVASGARRCGCGTVPGANSSGEPPWTPQRRREHDDWFAAWMNDPKNKKMLEGKPALRRIINALGKDIAGDEGDEAREPAEWKDVDDQRLNAVVRKKAS